MFGAFIHCQGMVSPDYVEGAAIMEKMSELTLLNATLGCRPTEHAVDYSHEKTQYSFIRLVVEPAKLPGTLNTCTIWISFAFTHDTVGLETIQSRPEDAFTNTLNTAILLFSPLSCRPTALTTSEVRSVQPMLEHAIRKAE